MSETPGIYNVGKTSDTPSKDAMIIGMISMSPEEYEDRFWRDPLRAQDDSERYAKTNEERKLAAANLSIEELNARLAERTQDHLKASERDVAEIQRLRVENDALKRRLADLEAEHVWRPIEEAPKDGKEVWGIDCEKDQRPTWWHEKQKRWMTKEGMEFRPIEGQFEYEPTHFRPLPKPPQSTP